MEAVSSKVLRSENDRISRLPDPVICHILSFLGTKVVVSTSILSKRWRYVWTGVTALDFVEDGDSDDEKEDEGGKSIKFVQFVDKVLLQHDVKILEKFSLIGGRGCKREPVHVNRWISYAIVRNVKSLTVCVNSVKINLPGALFISATLAYLRLYGKFKLKLPPVVCLPKLEVLNLTYLCYESDKCASKLISGCPVLHSLSISRNSNKVLGFRISSPSLKRLEMYIYPDDDDHDVIIEYDGKLAIDAPNLEYLKLIDHVSCEVSITRLTSAESVDIDLGFNVDSSMAVSESIVKLVEALNNVNFLKLEGRIMNELSYANIPLSVGFDRLTKLEIYYECCHWSYLSVLLGRLMKLQVLKIERNFCYEMAHEVCWKDPMEVPVCLSSTLKQISISSFEGLEDEMEMIRYMLKHGAVLKLIDLKTLPYDVEYKFELLQTISMFPRLSSACSIKLS